MNANAQQDAHMGDQWVFPQGLKFDFRSGSLVVDTSECNIIAPLPANSTASICDRQGNILFYIGQKELPDCQCRAEVYSSDDNMVENGDSLNFAYVLSNTYTISMIPSPADTNQFYILQFQEADFATWYNCQNGFSYSLIDKSFNNGQGKVIQKNIPVMNDTLAGWMAITRHANGRDWWIVMHEITRGYSSDIFYVFLLSPTGFSAPFIEHIGPKVSALQFFGIQGSAKFSPDGSRMLFANMGTNDAALFDFDRCSGQLSNYQPLLENIHFDSTTNTGPQSPIYVSFSPNGQIGYLLSPWYLFQQDLNNISNIRIDSFYNNLEVVYNELAPDGKLYFVQYHYQLPSGTLDKNFFIINNPNVFGSGCNAQDTALNLLGHHPNDAMPYIPNYGLGPLAGSPCDTLGVKEIPKPNYHISIAPNPASNRTTVFYTLPNGAEAQLSIYNNLGLLLQTTTLKKGTNHLDIDVSKLPSGLYYVSVGTDRWCEGEKFVVEE